MNGPDLKLLAERAAGLEDRTTARLAQVHGRIETTRRRRRAVGAAGVAFVVVAVLVSLTLLDHVPGRDTPSPAPQPTPTPTTFDPVASVPKSGTCWEVPPQSAHDPSYWFDDSQKVACTEPHTTETGGYSLLPEATAAQARGSLDDCWNKVRVYLGVDGQHWIPWGFNAFLPSRAQVAEGATWLRCDAVIPARWAGHDAGVRTLTRSWRGIAVDPPSELWACLDQPPSVDQPFVPCDQPHLYEETGTLARIIGETTYPSAAMRNAAAQAQCPAGVPEGVTGVTVTAPWDPPGSFKPGTEIAGPCFFFHTDGTPLPPR